MKTLPVMAGITRWIARIAGILVSAIFIGLFIWDYPAPFENWKILGTAAHIGFAGIVLVVVGFGAAWRWEMIGGLVSLVGVCMVWPLRDSGFITACFFCLGATALLFLTSCILRRKAEANKSATANALDVT